MRINITISKLFVLTFLVLNQTSNGQTVTIKVNLPAQREATILSGNEFLAERGKVIELEQDSPDPFIGKVIPVQEADKPNEKLPIVNLFVNEADLLRNLSNSLLARGTAIMGADKFLLLRQKRFKVGDSITISFEGKDYEVWLSDVTSTTFTIRRNELTHTRAVLLSR